MKLVYIARATIPSQSANSIHVMKICEEFSKIVDEFTLIIQDCKENISCEDEFLLYGLKNRFPIMRIKKPQILGGLYRYYFAICAMRTAKKLHCEGIVTRDPIVALLSVLSHKNVLLDLHGDIKHLCGRLYRIIRYNWFVNSPYLHLVTITEGLQKYYTQEYGVPKDKMTVLPDGYKAENFENIQQIGRFQGEEFNIGYCGGFLEGKGLKIIYEIAKRDPKNSYNLYGGTEQNAASVLCLTGTSDFPSNLHFGGYIPNSQIPQILTEQDILLLPNQISQICKGEDIGKVTSPLKMFEYMASGRVIIASNISALKEILNENNSFLVEPDNVQAWLDVIEYINANRDEALQKGKQAKQDVLQYSWKMRAEKILTFLMT